MEITMGKLRKVKWMAILGLSLSIGCVTTSYSQALLSKGNTTTVVNGQLEGTRSLPPRGKGYRTYNYLGSALGRQYAHHKVIETLEDAFSNLHETTGQTFDVAEIGAKHGGKFLPHFTHREGMSVNIMTPMKKELVNLRGCLQDRCLCGGTVGTLMQKTIGKMD